MSIPKEDIELDNIIDLLKKAPTDDGTLYGAIYDLYVFIGIAKGVHDIQNGNGITLEEFNKEREELYGHYTRKFS